MWFPAGAPDQSAGLGRRDGPRAEEGDQSAEEGDQSAEDGDQSAGGQA